MKSIAPFVNSEWLDQVAPYGWQVTTDGELIYRQSDPTWPAIRVLHSGLPEAKCQTGTFEVITNMPSHHAIAEYLATQMGLEFYCNTPDMDLVQSFKAEAGQGYFEAIKKLFSVWTPQVVIEGVPGGTGRLYITDTAGEEQTLEQPCVISVGPKAITKISIDDNSFTEPIVDHVIIKGAKIFSGVPLFKYGDNVLKTVELEQIEVAPNLTLQYETLWQESTGYMDMGDYDKKFGKVTDEKQDRIVRAILTEHYHVPENDKSNMHLVKHQVDEYDKDDVLIRSVTTDHHYGKGFAPIRHIERERQLLLAPGLPYKVFRLVRESFVDESNYIPALKRSATTEITRECVAAIEVTTPEGEYLTAARPLIQAQSQNMVLTTPGSPQILLEMETKRKYTTYNKTGNTLLQIVTERDNISGVTKSQTVVIRDPESSQGRDRTPETQLQWEFFKDGTATADNSRAVTIEHPDIASEEQAQAIARRAFARSGQRKIKCQVQISAPLALIGSEGAILELETMTVTTKRGLTSTDTEIPGGMYRLVGVEEAAAVRDTSIDHNQTWNLCSVF